MKTKLKKIIDNFPESYLEPIIFIASDKTNGIKLIFQGNSTDLEAQVEHLQKIIIEEARTVHQSASTVRLLEELDKDNTLPDGMENEFLKANQTVVKDLENAISSSNKPSVIDLKKINLN